MMTLIYLGLVALAAVDFALYTQSVYIGIGVAALGLVILKPKI